MFRHEVIVTPPPPFSPGGHSRVSLTFDRRHLRLSLPLPSSSVALIFVGHRPRERREKRTGGSQDSLKNMGPFFVSFLFPVMRRQAGAASLDPRGYEDFGGGGENFGLGNENSSLSITVPPPLQAPTPRTVI